MTKVHLQLVTPEQAVADVVPPHVPVASQSFFGAAQELFPPGVDLATHGRIAITGAPAAGKSTLTRQLTVLAAREQDLRAHDCIVPLRIQAIDLNKICHKTLSNINHSIHN